MKIGASIRALIIVLSVLLGGCLEASFKLDDSSRLPKWVEVPQGLARNQLTVTMDYYSTFDGGKYVFTVRQKGSLFALQKNVVHTSESPEIETKRLKETPPNAPPGYPAYNVIRINGTVDVVERKKMEPYFYMVDDPAVWTELGADTQP